MIEAVLLTCFQANIIITRIKVDSTLTEPQKVELIREVRILTRKDCPIY